MFSVTSAAKAGLKGKLKCTAEAVLHPDKPIQDLLYPSIVLQT